MSNIFTTADEGDFITSDDPTTLAYAKVGPAPNTPDNVGPFTVFADCTDANVAFCEVLPSTAACPIINMKVTHKIAAGINIGGTLFPLGCHSIDMTGDTVIDNANNLNMPQQVWEKRHTDGSVFARFETRNILQNGVSIETIESVFMTSGRGVEQVSHIQSDVFGLTVDDITANDTIGTLTGIGELSTAALTSTATFDPGGTEILIEWTKGDFSCLAPLLTVPVFFGDFSPSIDVGEIDAFTATATNTDFYSITGGTDAALFEIISNTGVVTFIDPSSEGSFDVEITASNAIGTDVQSYAVSVSVGSFSETEWTGWIFTEFASLNGTVVFDGNTPGNPAPGYTIRRDQTSNPADVFATTTKDWNVSSSPTSLDISVDVKADDRNTAGGSTFGFDILIVQDSKNYGLVDSSNTDWTTNTYIGVTATSFGEFTVASEVVTFTPGSNPDFSQPFLLGLAVHILGSGSGNNGKFHKISFDNLTITLNP